MAMKAIKAVLLVTAIAMALTIALMKNMQLREEDDRKPSVKTASSSSAASSSLEQLNVLQSERASRFLVEASKKPRMPPIGGSSHGQYCPTDNRACLSLSGLQLNTTCCNRKCTDLLTDWANCGECKRKCKFNYACCHGGCVDLAYDKLNCGKCGNKCKHGHYCIYGLCDYA